MLTHPTRSSHKSRKVDRNKGISKAILNKISKERIKASPQTLVARASFSTNLFHRNSILSSFQLARRFSPSLLGIPAKIVSQELLDAHKDMKAIRALHKALNSREYNTTLRIALTIGREV